MKLRTTLELSLDGSSDPLRDIGAFDALLREMPGVTIISSEVVTNGNGGHVRHMRKSGRITTKKGRRREGLTIPEHNGVRPSVDKFLLRVAKEEYPRSDFTMYDLIDAAYASGMRRGGNAKDNLKNSVAPAVSKLINEKKLVRVETGVYRLP